MPGAPSRGPGHTAVRAWSGGFERPGVVAVEVLLDAGDVLRAGQRVGEPGDADPDVAGGLTRLVPERRDLLGDLQDLVVAQPPAQQRHERDVVLRRDTGGVALEQPVHDAAEAGVQWHGTVLTC